MAQKGSTQKKKKSKSIRNSRWAVIIASVLAFGMLLSSVALYLGYLNRGEAGSPDQGWDLEAFLEQYRYNAEQLEAYIEEHGPNTAVLENLAENYYYLLMLQQMLAEDTDDLAEYQDKLVGVYESLLELEPLEPRYHMDLLYVYQAVEIEESVMMAQVARLQELLQDSPAPQTSLSLIGFLKSIDSAELMQEEAARLRAYLEEQLADETMDNQNRYLYAVLLGEYLDELEAALAQLDLLLDSESGESDLYEYVQEYRNRLTAEEDSGDNGD